MTLVEVIAQIDALKAEINRLRPIARETELRVLQKFRLDWNYHSNALEGNTLTYGETRAFLLHGVTAQGRPFRDYLDMKGHKEAIEYLEEFVRQNHELTEADIRGLHKVLLVEDHYVDAITVDGVPTRKLVHVGQYKQMPNSVRTSTGEMHFYASPEETPASMADLLNWYRRERASGELHPLLLAATFHIRFVNIHPFDDGNGRMARLLMNLILMQAGYTPVVININSKHEYLLALEKADSGELEDFILLVGQNLKHSLDIFLKAAHGEPVDDTPSLAEQAAVLNAKLKNAADNQSK
ncbi:MAG: Fic family protein [Caldilineaceae bacterium]|nr:Fic family protein [Caldilineaceae bacterium]MCB0141318.1 Fic family protein [Caldilineaceae bacterium]